MMTQSLLFVVVALLALFTSHLEVAAAVGVRGNRHLSKSSRWLSGHNHSHVAVSTTNVTMNEEEEEEQEQEQQQQHHVYRIRQSSSTKELYAEVIPFPSEFVPKSVHDYFTMNLTDDKGVDITPPVIRIPCLIITAENKQIQPIIHCENKDILLHLKIHEHSHYEMIYYIDANNHTKMVTYDDDNSENNMNNHNDEYINNAVGATSGKLVLILMIVFILSGVLYFTYCSCCCFESGHKKENKYLGDDDETNTTEYIPDHHHHHPNTSTTSLKYQPNINSKVDDATVCTDHEDDSPIDSNTMQDIDLTKSF